MNHRSALKGILTIQVFGGTLYLDILSIATGSDVRRSLSSTGTSAGAALLVDGAATPPPVQVSPMSISDKTYTELLGYAAQWLQNVKA